MNTKLLIIMIVGAFLQCLYDIFITNRISEREAKKAKYVCENCNNWRCYYHWCKKQREKLQNK